MRTTYNVTGLSLPELGVIQLGLCLLENQPDRAVSAELLDAAHRKTIEVQRVQIGPDCNVKDRVSMANDTSPEFIKLFQELIGANAKLKQQIDELMEYLAGQKTNKGKFEMKHYLVSFRVAAEGSNTYLWKQRRVCAKDEQEARICGHNRFTFERFTIDPGAYHVVEESGQPVVMEFPEDMAELLLFILRREARRAELSAAGYQSSVGRLHGRVEDMLQDWQAKNKRQTTSVEGVGTEARG